MKNTKGITLIALIITIIVMLILVSVTITIAVNGGLFGYAKNAVVATNEKMNEEEGLINVPANLSADELIEYFSEDTTEEDLANLRTAYIGNVSDAGITDTQNVNGSQATHFDGPTNENGFYYDYIKYKGHIYKMGYDDNTMLVNSVILTEYVLRNLGLQPDGSFVTIANGTKAQGEYTVSGNEYIIDWTYYYNSEGVLLNINYT